MFGLPSLRIWHQPILSKTDSHANKQANQQDDMLFLFNDCQPEGCLISNGGEEENVDMVAGSSLTPECHNQEDHRSFSIADDVLDAQMGGGGLEALCRLEELQLEEESLRLGRIISDDRLVEPARCFEKVPDEHHEDVYNLKTLLSAKPASSQYLSSLRCDINNIDYLIFELGRLKSKISDLEDSHRTELRDYLQCVMDQITSMSRFLKGARDIPATASEKAALGITLLDAAYHEHKAQQFSQGVEHLNGVLAMRQDNVYMSSLSYMMNHRVMSRLWDIVSDAIENDPRLDAPIEALSVSVRRTFQNNGWKTLRDIARMNSRELIDVPGVGPVTYARIWAYFCSHNLPHLLVVPPEQINTLTNGPLREWHRSDINTNNGRWMLPKIYSRTGKADVFLSKGKSIWSGQDCIVAQDVVPEKDVATDEFA